MGATSPLVFRPSLPQRALALLLCAGSWLAGVRGLVLLIQNVPRLLGAIRLAEAAGEPTWGLWGVLALGLMAIVAGGALLLLSVVGLLLIEGTQVLVDDLGLAVELTAFPAGLGRRLGGGRLTWKQVAALEKGRIFFRIRGGGEPGPDGALAVKPPVLRFLMVDELERLVLLVLERSPNLTFRD